MKVGGWAGVSVFVILVTASLMVLDAPQYTDSVADHRTWFANNQTKIAFLTWLLPLGYLLVLLFASGLRSLLGPADSASKGMWSRFSFAAAVMMVSAAGVGWAFWAVLGLDDVLALASDATVRALSALFIVIFSAIVAAAQAAFMFGASVVILRSGVMARWIGWLGSGVAVLTVLASLWRTSGDPEGLINPTSLPGGFLVWTLIVGITMIRSNPATSSTEETSPTGRN